MAFQLEASDQFGKDYRALCKKNNVLRKAIDSKIHQICETSETNPDHYKPLAAPMARADGVWGEGKTCFRLSVGNSWTVKVD